VNSSCGSSVDGRAWFFKVDIQVRANAEHQNCHGVEINHFAEFRVHVTLSIPVDLQKKWIMA